jgi:hypothetical protein
VNVSPVAGETAAVSGVTPLPLEQAFRHTSAQHAKIALQIFLFILDRPRDTDLLLKLDEKLTAGAAAPNPFPCRTGARAR